MAIDDHPGAVDTASPKGPRSRNGHVVVKLGAWAADVATRGVEEVRRVPGYHDEPLKGQRVGQRSIRLSRTYRAIYVVRRDTAEFVSVEEVNKHDY